MDFIVTRNEMHSPHFDFQNGTDIFSRFLRLIAYYPHVPLLLLFLCLGFGAAAQSHAEYIGGTETAVTAGHGGSIDISDDRYFAFYSKGEQIRVPYERINLLEYGQKVDRRLMLAVIISPAFMLAKTRKHFLSVGYVDDDGKQQAMVFRVDKNGIRATLVGLEARTGMRVQYQDVEARKAGKG